MAWLDLTLAGQASNQSFKQRLIKLKDLKKLLYLDFLVDPIWGACLAKKSKFSLKKTQLDISFHFPIIYWLVIFFLSMYGSKDFVQENLLC